MKNPFLQPNTTGEWLRSSLCWTGSCLVALLLLHNLLAEVPWPPTGDAKARLWGGSLCVAHGVLWWRAVAGGRALIRHDEQRHYLSWTRLAASLWLVLLTVCQLGCLLGLVLASVAVLGKSPIIKQFIN